ncbi:hypothetical protein M0804_003431 [Polistes exclamans]|nr:hypothetical protein M0804_003431 [Polistes exclamans]
MVVTAGFQPSLSTQRASPGRVLRFSFIFPRDTEEIAIGNMIVQFSVRLIKTVWVWDFAYGQADGQDIAFAMLKANTFWNSESYKLTENS